MLFPGQGSQYVGMGKDYYDAFEHVRDLYKSANRALGFDIAELSFAGDLDELTKTHNAQPAILLHSLAVFTALVDRGVVPGVVAGHSLGEFSALVAAGALEPIDALLIVRKRGELMYEAGLDQPGTMAAILGLDAKGVEEAVVEAGEAGVVVVANYNSPEQYAVSGEVAAVERAIEVARSKGAKRAMKLQVSGAFHSPLMEHTAGELTAYMKQFDRGDLKVSWIANVTGELVEDNELVPDLVARQLSSPVLWTKSMQTLAGLHAGSAVEVGPGKVLTGLMRRIEPSVAVTPLTSIEGFEAVQGT